MHRTIYFLALFFAAVLAAPPPERQNWNPGDIVGVRPGEYETKPKVGRSLSQIPKILIFYAGGVERC